MGNVTKKQIVTLFIVAWILVIMVMVMYVFLPKFDEMSTADEDIFSAEEQYMSMSVNGAMSETYREESEEYTEKIKNALSPYYREKRNSEIDNEILSIAARCGIKAKGLSIGDKTEFESIENIDELKNKINNNSLSDTEYDDEYYEEDSEDYDGDESSDSEGKENASASGFFYTVAEYSLTADYSQILSFISDINAHDSFYFGSISFAQTLDDGTDDNSEDEMTEPAVLGEKMEAAISIIAFMHPEEL